jgi:hypothetical protein
MVRFLRVVATVVALFCFLTWGAGAADKFVYSGGKWRRASKVAKDKGAETPEKEGKRRAPPGKAKPLLNSPDTFF